MKILVVDDEEGLRDICERKLRRAGHEVRCCVSGEEALPVLGEGWDLVLTDIVMPGKVDGNELLRRVRRQGRADVMLMTAQPALDSAVRAVKDGAYDYLIKPFDLDSMIGAVNRCAEKRSLSRELAREKALRSKLAEAFQELSRMNKVRETFGKFATPEVARFILEQPDGPLKRGERRNVTVLFADVRQFTPFAGSVPPEEAVQVLNEILACVIDAVQKEGGIVNKFIGDGLMAIFGAPLARGDHAQAAARAALRARDAVESLTASRRAAKREPLRLGFGINSGEVVAGCIGTRDRTEYGVIGHAVNVAARLEEIAGPGQILIGPDTAELLDRRFWVGDPFEVELAGVPGPFHAAELHGLRQIMADAARPVAYSQRL